MERPAGIAIVGAGQREGKQGSRRFGGLATFLVFALAGPLVGGGAMILALVLLGAVPAGFAGDPASAFFFSSATVLVPIVAVGIAIAVLDARGRPVSAMPASGLGASAGVAWGLFLASIGATGTLSILAFVGSIIATVACWRLTRGFGGAI